MTGGRLIGESIVTLARCGIRATNRKIAASKPNNPNPYMLNKLAQLLPVFVLLAIATPSFADNDFSHNHNRRQIAYGEMGRMNKLNLTPDQKTKMEQLRASTRSQIDAVLTPAQRQQRQQIEAQRQANKGDNGMNLTADQKAKLKAIREANQAQFKAMLTPAQQAQLSQEGGRMGKGGFNKLNLTAEQKAKMEQLRASAQSQMAAVLTPAQQQQFTARRERRQGMRNSWQSMNLTADQQAKIKTIREASERQLNSILTPEQQSQRKSHQRGG
jgi:periplasmic protein CpxP/Spy